MSYDWTEALTPTDTKAWAAALSGNGGLQTVGLRELDLNRSGKKLSSSDVADYGLTTHSAQAFKWNSGDDCTNQWRPQGICGIRLNQPRLSMVAVSWYNHEKQVPNIDKGVRVSFVDVTPGSQRRFKYRHALLVEKSGASNFEPVTVHAGGLGYSRGYLFVPDTYKGIRVFDLSLMLKGLSADSSKTKCGFIDGAAYAFDYRYIVPQVYYYDGLYNGLKASGMAEASGNRPKFSYLSMDWTDSERRILTGSYMDTGDFDSGKRPSAFLWKVSSEHGGRLDVGSTPRNIGIPTGYRRFRWIQGAAISGSKLYISRSTGLGIKRHTLSGSFNSDDYSVGVSQTDVAPQGEKSVLGFEDLHMSLNSDILWGLSEGNRGAAFIGDRIVFWLKGVR